MIVKSRCKLFSVMHAAIGKSVTQGIFRGKVPLALKTCYLLLKGHSKDFLYQRKALAEKNPNSKLKINFEKYKTPFPGEKMAKKWTLDR